MFTPLDDDLSTYGELISVEAFQGIATGINYLIDSMAPGQIICILTGLPGCPTPDSRLWQLCDGSLITDENSDLRGSNTPDMRDRFMKGANTPGEAGTASGSNTKTFAHSHGGVTQANPAPDNGEFGVNYLTIYSHTHTIPTALAAAVNVEPVHYRVEHYIKIR
jgi:hypothetical protein